MSTANMNTIREAAKVNPSFTYGPEGKWGWRGENARSARGKFTNPSPECPNVLLQPRTADKKPPAFNAGAAGRSARKAAAAVLASCARIVAMTAFCVALVALPAACTAITGHTPINCEVAYCDL